MERRYPIRVMDDKWLEDNVRCQCTCPIHTDARGYIRLIAEGRFQEAFALAREPNPFVNVCARVCAHPCEDKCRRGLIDEPVAICALKRFATDHPVPEPLFDAPIRGTGPKVAVVGAGPAGLSGAHDLALWGYRVTVFEALPVAGGMLSVGLPPYRLPKEAVQRDVSAVTNLGVELKLNSPVRSLQELKQQGFEAVLLAVGCMLSRPLPIPGSDLPGVLKGVGFLRDVNLGRRVNIGQRVLVIGGGNVAIDVARSALRVGAEEVHLTCLEARHEMPAHDYEIEEAEREGVILHCSKGPQRVIGEHGRVVGLETLVCTSVFDEQRRFNPQLSEDSEEIIECDTIILAIGQMSDWSLIREGDGVTVTPRGIVQVDLESCQTTAPGVFLAGDAGHGPRLIVDAIAAGRRAARYIDIYLLKGQNLCPTEKERERVERDWYRPHDDYLRLSRSRMPMIDVSERGGMIEVETGLTEEQAMSEARRCLQCNLNPAVDAETCVLCGGCIDACPMGCLRLVDLSVADPDERAAQLIAEELGIDAANSYLAGHLDLEGSLMLKDEDRCIRCGICAKRCPAGAMRMEELV